MGADDVRLCRQVDQLGDGAVGEGVLQVVGVDRRAVRDHGNVIRSRLVRGRVGVGVGVRVGVRVRIRVRVRVRVRVRARW